MCTVFDTNTINFDVHYNFCPIILLLTGKKIKRASIRIYAGMASFDTRGPTLRDFAYEISLISE